jgi:O-acetyl-ADP-ribose deacetylase (regulator of RNase III)
VPFKIIRDDITKIKVDAIVNSANPHAIVGGGVDYAIHAAAGPQLIEARKKIGDIPTGYAFITPAYNLDAKYVIHTVGPVWHGGSNDESYFVRRCYRNCLYTAIENGCESIAFPLISAGIFGFPIRKSLEIAKAVISDFLSKYDIDVTIVVFDKEFNSLSDELFKSISEFIDEKFIDKSLIYNTEINDNILFQIAQNTDLEKLESKRSLDNLIDTIDDTFSESLLRLIKEKNKTEVEVYKKANVDRKLFSKIRSNADYQPSKITAISFAIALQLNFDETKDLMNRAGFALSHSFKFDIVIEYCIVHEIFDVFDINDILFNFGLPLLGV